jgi:hypothetical protein
MSDRMTLQEMRDENERLRRQNDLLRAANRLSAAIINQLSPTEEKRRDNLPELEDE